MLKEFTSFAQYFSKYLYNLYIGVQKRFEYTRLELTII